MSASWSILPKHLPRRAFGKIVLNEARLAWRLSVGLIFGVGLPVLLLVIFGEIPAFQKHKASLGGLTAFNVYVPILIAFVIAALALWSLPGPLVSYREQGILRRLSTTPVPPSWVLAAQVIVHLCLVVIALFILVVVGIAAFGIDAPKSPGGLLLAIVLSIAALFAIELSIAAVARTANGAAALGSATFLPLMFFAGLWVPRQLMPGALQGISNFTPLGASVEAVQDSMQGVFPPATALLVLAAYAMIFVLVAKCFFRWE